MERNRQSLLDKAIGPSGLPSLRSALALSTAACKEKYCHWQVRNADDGATDSLYAKHEKVGFMLGGLQFGWLNRILAMEQKNFGNEERERYSALLGLK